MNCKVPPTKVTLLATDGYVTTDATEVLNKMNTHGDDTLAVLSCGGNDALEFRASEDMQKHVYSILQGMEVLLPHLQQFEKDYERALWIITNTYEKKNVFHLSVLLLLLCMSNITQYKDGKSMCQCHS